MPQWNVYRPDLQHHQCWIIVAGVTAETAAEAVDHSRRLPGLKWITLRAILATRSPWATFAQ